MSVSQLTKRIKPTPATGARISLCAYLEVSFFSNIYSRLARLMRLPLGCSLVIGNFAFLKFEEIFCFWCFLEMCLYFVLLFLHRFFVLFWCFSLSQTLILKSVLFLFDQLRCSYSLGSFQSFVLNPVYFFINGLDVFIR